MHFKPSQLDRKQRRLKLRDAKIAAQHFVIVPIAVLGTSAMRKAAAQVGQPFVIGHQDAALAGSDILGYLKAKRSAPTDRTGTATLPLAAPGMRGIFQHRQAILPGERVDGRHIGDASAHVDRNDRSCACGHFVVRIAGIKAQRIGIDIGENRNGTQRHDRTGRGDKRVRRHDHFVARQNAQCPQSHFNRRGAVRAADAVRGPLKRRKFLFETAHVLAVPPFARAQHFQQRRLFRFVMDGPRGPVEIANRLAALNGQTIGSNKFASA